MLDFYRRIAQRLHGARPVFRASAGLGVAAFVILLLLPGVPAGPTYAFFAITVALWSFFLILVIDQFSAPIPAVEPGSGLRARIRIRLRRAVLLASALVLSLMALVIGAYTGIALAGLFRSF